MIIRRAGVIAAGHGTRLADRYPGQIKPLLPVAGRPLCHWVIASLLQAGAREITLLHNSSGRAVRESLERAFPQTRWIFLEADTASSWESFRLVSRAVARADEPFIISTVDAIVPPTETARFAREVSESGARVGLALTSFINDEKPLFAELGPRGLLTKLGETCTLRQYATAGLYYLTPQAVARMPEAAAHSSLRGFLTDFVGSGAPVAGCILSKTLDVDRPEDIVQAEGFLKEAIVSW